VRHAGTEYLAYARGAVRRLGVREYVCCAASGCGESREGWADESLCIVMQMLTGVVEMQMYVRGSLWLTRASFIRYPIFTCSSEPGAQTSNVSCSRRRKRYSILQSVLGIAMLQEWTVHGVEVPWPDAATSF
jgi:hypothetical protein